ncbi:hypothetical protein LTR95_007374, partial [Oleoguttula sp. CCFEE 5521]
MAAWRHLLRLRTRRSIAMLSDVILSLFYLISLHRGVLAFPGPVDDFGVAGSDLHRLSRHAWTADTSLPILPHVDGTPSADLSAIASWVDDIPDGPRGLGPKPRSLSGVGQDEGAGGDQDSSHHVNRRDPAKSGPSQVDYGVLYESDRHFDLFQAKQVGHWLNAYLNATIDSSCVLESGWSDFAALDAHGWVEQRPDNKTVSPVSDAVKAFFNTVKSALVLQDRVEDVAIANWQHSQVRTISGVTYQPTRGFYDQAY